MSYGCPNEPTGPRASVQDPIHPATSYTYDPNGNLASVQDPLGHTTGYVYDEANEPVKVTQPDASVLLTGYDGARTGQADSVGGTSASYGYDQADRLTGYTSGATTASYAYDGDGLRASKTVNGTVTAETWDVAEGLPTLLQDGATRYIDGPGGTPVEQVDGAGTVRFYRQDHLGSTRGLADASGAITDSYDPYGQRTAVTGSAAPTPFGYAGQYTDGETGFQYLWARYYDPATGQFLTVDPLVDSTGHPYAYAGDNPVNYSDPSGMCQLGPISVPIGGDGNCSDSIKGQIGSFARNLNDAITSFNNSDLSNSVIGDLQGVVRGAQTTLAEGKACFQDAVACGKLALALALYVRDHPGDVLNSAVAAQLANLDQLRQEIDCGRYGLAAGHLLVGFVEFFGPAKIGELLKGIAAGGDAEAAAAHAFNMPTRCGCFPGDTGVATPSGLMAIVGIHVGDQVLSEDPKSGKVEPERVQAVIDDGVKPLMTVGLSDGSSLRVTTNHPFYIDGGPSTAAPGWVEAGDLKVGDRLRTEDGRGIAVASLRYHTGEAHVYTLTVAKDHTFFVGTTGIPVLVHNLACKPNVDIHTIPDPLHDLGGFVAGVQQRIGHLYDSEAGFAGHLTQVRNNFIRIDVAIREAIRSRNWEVYAALKRAQNQLHNALDASTTAARKAGKASAISFQGI